MKILNAMWFTEMGKSKPIGIVIVEMDGEQQAYIGTSEHDDELKSAILIAKRGARFPVEVARVLMPHNTIRL
jgi:hypothetical protein